MSQGWLPGGGDAAVVRRNKPGEGCSWQGALTGQRSGGQKWKQFAVPGTQRGEEEAGAEGGDLLVQGLMCQVKGLELLFMRLF